MSQNFELLNAEENLNDLNDAYEESGEEQICRFFSSDAFNEEFGTVREKDLSVIHCNGILLINCLLMCLKLMSCYFQIEAKLLPTN